MIIDWTKRIEAIINGAPDKDTLTGEIEKDFDSILNRYSANRK